MSVLLRSIRGFGTHVLGDVALLECDHLRVLGVRVWLDGLELKVVLYHC